MQDKALPEPEADEEQLDVVAVGAHPDDIEIACGGTLAKLASQGYRVGIIDLTNRPRCATIRPYVWLRPTLLPRCWESRFAKFCR